MESPVMRLPNRYKRHFSSRLSVDCYVPLDSTLTHDENIVIVLDHVLPSTESACPKTRQLGHLNNLVGLLRKDEESNFPTQVLLCSLRLLLTSESKELRTAGLRCLRHAVKTRQDLRIVYQEKIECLVVKCLDVCMENESERVQALRLLRQLISLDPMRIPRIITHSIGSVCNSSDDSLRCVSVETICEMAIMNPKAFGDFDVINLLLHSAIDIDQSTKVTTLLFGVVLHLLNRMECWNSLDLEYVISPLMEVYFHHPKPGKGLQEEKVESRLLRCRMALNTILRSWTGVSRLCTPNPCGIRSLINLLCISNARIQVFIMEILQDQLFGKKVHVFDGDFSKTVSNYVEMGTDQWTLHNGFVVKEGLDLLSNKQKSTFVDHHKSILLSCLLQTGLCETLVDVATGTKNEDICITSTILLAEILDLCQSLLPALYESTSVCTSSLLSNSACSDNLAIKSKARQTVNRLQEHHIIKARQMENSSLFLQAVYYQTKLEKPPLSSASKDSLEPVEPVLRDFQAIFPRDSRTWDWDIISMVLESAYDLPKSGEDEGHFRFVRRLVHFFKPSSRYYAIIRLDEDYAHSLTVLACQLIVFLVESEHSEAALILYDFLGDIANCIKEVTLEAVTGDPLLSPNRIRTSLSQHYFLMIGHLTHYAAGEKFLERSGLVEALMDLIGKTLHPDYVKLSISALNYGNNPVGKVLLCKALTASCEDGRLYSCHFLALLMKLKVPGVHDWGMNLLVTQLVDQSGLVSETALKILENLCEDQDLLENLIATLPPLMHLGEKGIFLLAMLMSLPSGFKIFTDAKVLPAALERWRETYNQEYVRIDEEHRENAFDENFVIQRSYPLAHLYGQLVQHDEGFELMMKQDCINDYIKCLKTATQAHSYAETLALKTALWALGHIGSSRQGAEWLEHEGVLSMMMTLSTCSSNLTVRATAFSAVNLVAKSERGRALVERYGWISLLHERQGNSSHSSSFSSGSGSFSNSDFFPDSFRKPIFSVSSCPEVRDYERIHVKPERGQSDSIVHSNHNHNNNFVRSATVSTCSSSTKTSDSEPKQSHKRTVSLAPSIVSWPTMGKSENLVTDDDLGSPRPYYRSFSAIVGAQKDVNGIFNEQERSAKLYLVDKISGRRNDRRGLCVPVPLWNLFKIDNLKKEEIPETVVEVSNGEEKLSTEEEIRRRILQMCGLRGQKTAENEILKLKQKHSELFHDEKFYESICELLNEHYFGQTARRFIQELFLDVSFTDMYAETRRMYDEVRPQFARTDETTL